MKKAIIVLHEIHGVTPFIQEIGQWLGASCPSLMPNGEVFATDDEAYPFFMEHVGFDRGVALIEEQIERYDAVTLIGFSVGATIAWRLSTNDRVTKVVAIYGSRIRDYLTVQPKVPTLVALSESESFAVNGATVERFAAKHGFMNPLHPHYNEKEAKRLKQMITTFIQ